MWSQGKQLFCGAEKGGFVELAMEVRKPGRYRLRVLATAAPDFGTIRMALDGKRLGPRIRPVLRSRLAVGDPGVGHPALHGRPAPHPLCQCWQECRPRADIPSGSTPSTSCPTSPAKCRVGQDGKAIAGPPNCDLRSVVVGRRSQARWSHPTRIVQCYSDPEEPNHFSTVPSSWFSFCPVNARALTVTFSSLVPQPS